MLQMQHPFRKALSAIAHALYLLPFHYFQLEKEQWNFISSDSHQQG